jgi:antitoxin PrlF
MRRRISSKGQVTIPRAIREKAGLRPSVEVEVEIEGETVCIRRAHSRTGRGSGADLVAHTRGRDDGTLTTDEIMALTRGE